MGHAGAVVDHAFNASQGFSEHPNFQATEKPAHDLQIIASIFPFQAHGDHSTTAFHLPPAQRVLRMAGETRIMHLRHIFVLHQEFSNLLRVATLPLHANCQRLHSAQGQICLKGTRDGTHAFGQGVEPLSQVLVAHHQGTAGHVGVAPNVFAGRNHHNVYAQLQGLLIPGSCKGVVCTDQNGRLLWILGRTDSFNQLCDVHQGQQGIRWALHPDHASVLLDLGANILQIVEVQVCEA
mmetsp:Transcript_70251/g.154927  ORF Transcript_70251/g.154927 Transcript_70251/m.154927 type:complete len:237 (+) Transcript_70251:140-850(+)